ncbi:MAG TPA: YdjY domain-containing protein, partial [Tepidisphaeraceae bacterium]|nr:YdjY domain-containing protein [Tepidisphaeraceae bacterium]
HRIRRHRLPSGHGRTPHRHRNPDPSLGPELKVYLEIPTAAGDMQRIPIEKSLVDKKTGKAMPTLKWIFTGSVMRQPDPTKEEKVYGADLSGTLIGIFPVTDETVIQTNLTIKEEPLLKMETNKKVLPAIGTKVNLIIEAK